MNSFTTYVLYSRSKNKYYTGHTNNITRRLIEHNSGQNKSTKFGSPWKIIFTQEFDSNTNAILLESKIKKRGIKRFIQDLNLTF